MKNEWYTKITYPALRRGLHNLAQTLMTQTRISFSGVEKKEPVKPAAAKPKFSNPYRYTRKTRGLFDPKSKQTFRLSRSRIDKFLNCPRCFYLEMRLGIPQPSGYPFTLNSAVDVLLKKEFDIHRTKKTAHPLMSAYGLDAVPFQHPKLNDWRENFTGVQHLHKPTNFLITGAIDDVWVTPKQELLVVDYKATAKDGEVNLDADWQDGYKRQMEVYQWLLRKNEFSVSDTGYFVYANGQKDRKAFDGKLEFEVIILPYTGNDRWVEDTLKQARLTLEKNSIPKFHPDCEYCAYRRTAAEVE